MESEAHLAQEQGKTHVEFLHDQTFIAAGLVYEAVGQGYKAYMVTMEDVINTIKMKSLMPSAMSAYNRLLKADLVAIDDIMLFPVKKEDAAGFFQPNQHASRESIADNHYQQGTNRVGKNTG